MSINKTGKKETAYLAIAVFMAAAVVYCQYGIEGTLVRDDANHLYGGQQIVRGVPPYVSIFFHKGPLSAMICGAAVYIANLFDLNDIFTVRITFFIISCLVVASIFLLGTTLFQNKIVGILQALVFLQFWGFGRHALSGPRPKAPMVLFEILALLLTSRKQWFWAGVCGSLSALVWQPTTIFPLVTVFVAFMQSQKGRERARNLFHVFLGISVPVCMVSIYFLFKGAFYEFLDGTILFNLIHLDPEPLPHSILVQILLSVKVGYGMMMYPIFIGFLMVFAMYVRSINLYGRELLSRDISASVLLTFPAPIIWSFLDYQWYPDFYVFLPYLALGLGWLLYITINGINESIRTGPTGLKVISALLCAALIVNAASLYRRSAETGLRDQIDWARQIEELHIPGSGFVTVGAPEVLVLLKRTNPNRYVAVLNGFEHHMAANTPGGIDGWFEQLMENDPSVIVLGWTTKRFKPRLVKWLNNHYYRETKVGKWRVFFKKETSGL
jgi:hypothetical protein